MGDDRLPGWVLGATFGVMACVAFAVIAPGMFDAFVEFFGGRPR